MRTALLTFGLLFVVFPISAVGQKSSSDVYKHVLSGEIPPTTTRSIAPAKYHFTTEYTTLDRQGTQTGTRIVTADFTSSDKEVHWTSVTVGPAAGHGQPATKAERQAYMEGFHYPRDAQQITSAEFFRSFPQNSNDEKDLVWDELMFHSFASDIDRLRLNEPVTAQSGDVVLGGAGQFTNRQIELTLQGVGRRNGEDCLLIHYEALLNRFTLNEGPVTVSGRSDYSGTLWVSIRTRQIQYATMLEEVAGIISNIPGAPGPQPLNILRTATLERVP